MDSLLVVVTEVWCSSWFSVHCTSMNFSNHLMSSDNKGVASFLMEKYINGPDTMCVFVCALVH